MCQTINQKFFVDQLPPEMLICYGYDGKSAPTSWMSAPPSDTGGLRAVASPVEALVPWRQELDAAQLRQPQKTHHQKSAKKAPIPNWESKFRDS